MLPSLILVQPSTIKHSRVDHSAAIDWCSAGDRLCNRRERCERQLVRHSLGDVGTPNAERQPPNAERLTYRTERLNAWLLGLSTLLVFGPTSAQERWTPPARLQNVLVREDCSRTNGGIGIAFQPTLFNPHGAIFLCPKRAAEIDGTHPGASFFFRVHEYGHLALHTRNEALADAWAAEELSRSSAGRTTLYSAFSYFVDLGDRFAPMYGSGYDRALTVAKSGAIPQQDWPVALIDYRRSLSEKRARNGTIHLSIANQTADGLLWIDDRLIGFVSTVESDVNPPVPDLSGISHRLHLQDIWISESGSSDRLTAKGLEASAEFQGSNSAVGIAIHLYYQGDTLTVSLSK
jgi:hypothetical protein